MKSLCNARPALQVNRSGLHSRTAVRHVMRPTCAISGEDRQHMRHALELAKKGLGKTHPNPAVGCVILKDGKVGPHAPSGIGLQILLVTVLST